MEPIVPQEGLKEDKTLAKGVVRPRPYIYIHTGEVASAIWLRKGTPNPCHWAPSRACGTVSDWSFRLILAFLHRMARANLPTRPRFPGGLAGPIYPYHIYGQQPPNVSSCLGTRSERWNLRSHVQGSGSARTVLIYPSVPTIYIYIYI